MLKLEDREWRPYRLSSIGKIESGRDIYALERMEGNIPYITAGSQNNGIGYFVGNKNDTYDRGYIAINRNGAVGLAFYHPYWSVMGNDCRKLHLFEADENIYVGIFVATAISMQSKSFSYSRKLGTGRANKLQIMLPISINGDPDYKFMEDYIRERISQKREQYKNFVKNRMESLKLVSANWGGYSSDPGQRRWKVFSLTGDGGLFPIRATSTGIDGIKLRDGVDEIIPYITRTETNNGIAKFISTNNLEYGEDDGGCITIGLDTQTAYWQPTNFITGQNIHVLRSDKLNCFSAQFLTVVLRQQMKSKFNWGGNGATLGRLRKLRILLPVTEEGTPDYKYMESCGKQMLSKKYSQYLSYLNQSK